MVPVPAGRSSDPASSYCPCGGANDERSKTSKFRTIFPFFTVMCSAAGAVLVTAVWG